MSRTTPSCSESDCESHPQRSEAAAMCSRNMDSWEVCSLCWNLRPLRPSTNSDKLSEPGVADNLHGGVSNVDRDGNNTLEIKPIGVAISTFETLPTIANIHDDHGIFPSWPWGLLPSIVNIHLVVEADHQVLGLPYGNTANQHQSHSQPERP